MQGIYMYFLSTFSILILLQKWWALSYIWYCYRKKITWSGYDFIVIDVVLKHFMSLPFKEGELAFLCLCQSVRATEIWFLWNSKLKPSIGSLKSFSGGTYMYSNLNFRWACLISKGRMACLHLSSTFNKLLQGEKITHIFGCRAAECSPLTIFIARQSFVLSPTNFAKSHNQTMYVKDYLSSRFQAFCYSRIHLKSWKCVPQVFFSF